MSEPSLAPSALLTLAGARRALEAAEAEAAANGWKVTIVVADAGGTPLLLARDAFAATVEIAMGKARSAALFARPTAELEAQANVIDGAGRTSFLSAPFVTMRGGVPIVVGGAVVGAVGVSGVKAEQDEQIALRAVAAVTGSEPS